MMGLHILYLLLVCYTGVMNVEDDDHKNDQEVTSWKVLSPNAIQVRNVGTLGKINILQLNFSIIWTVHLLPEGLDSYFLLPL